MRRNTDLEATLVEKYAAIGPLLDERARRLWAATESKAIGYGGDAVVSAATGLARATIRGGRRELALLIEAHGRVRKPGAGRPPLLKTQPGIGAALEQLIDPLTRGDPMSPLRWTCKSKANLAAAMVRAGWKVSATKVGRMLHDLGYSLKAPQKSIEGAAHPDRNAQFLHINAMAEDFLGRGQPVPALLGSRVAVLLLHLVDTNAVVVEALRRHFVAFPEVATVHGDITQVAKGAVVSPANSQGFMDGGVDNVYAAFFGPALVRAVRDVALAQPEGHLPIGAAVAVSTGHPRIRHLVVAPTMIAPEHGPAENAYWALRAALKLMSRSADLGTDLYCPGLTTLVRGVDPDLAAAEMAEAYKDWRAG